MIDAIAAQQVEQRRYSADQTKVYRIDQIKQRPAYKKRARLKSGKNIFRRLNTFSQTKNTKSGFENETKQGYSPLRNKVAFRKGEGLLKRASLKVAKDKVSPLGEFLCRVLPLLALLMAAAYFLFIADLFASEAPLIRAPEDSLFERDLISYAGFPEDASPDTDDEIIPLDMIETFAWQTYRVKKGDSVFKIAQDHGISMDAVIASNGMTNAKKLFEGQELKIPNMDGIPYTVKRGDSLLKISGSLGVPLSAILDANDIESDDISPGTVLFIPGARMKTDDLKLALGEFFKYPIRGALTSPYGWRNDPISGARRYHAALDMAAATGTTVKASMDGRVGTVGYNNTYGKFIILIHSNGFQTLYAHLSAVSVSEGNHVSQGAKIGEVGSTGYSTGPHLHFAVYKNGRPVNPLEFLNAGL